MINKIKIININIQFSPLLSQCWARGSPQNEKGLSILSPPRHYAHYMEAHHEVCTVHQVDTAQWLAAHTHGGLVPDCDDDTRHTKHLMCFRFCISHYFITAHLETSLELIRVRRCFVYSILIIMYFRSFSTRRIMLSVCPPFSRTVFYTLIYFSSKTQLMLFLSSSIVYIT